jgi:hypothetical protein
LGKNLYSKKEDILLKTARIISLITFPISILFIAILWGNNVQFPGDFKFIFLLLISFIPTAIIYFKELYRDKSLLKPSISLNRVEREKVLGVYFFSLLLSLVLAAIFNLENKFLHSIIILIIFVGVVYLINKHIGKASLHASSFVFSVLFVAQKLDWTYSLILLGLPVIYWARLKLKQHSKMELLLGTVIGMLVGLLSWIG